MTSLSKTCPVCMEDFTKQKYKPCTCSFCDYTCCLQCSKRYLLDTTTEPRCMSCKRGFMREHLLTMFPASFIKGEYARHHQIILFERERCLLPQSQSNINTDTKIKTIEQKISFLRKQKLQAKKELRNTLDNPSTTDRNSVLKQWRRQVREINRRICDHKAEIFEVIVGICEDTTRPKQIRKCPSPECRGFLANNKCNLCKTEVCPSCWEIVMPHTDHVCNPDTIETVKVMKRDTKNCPNCTTPIFKISGCSQMWCTKCHVAFDWQTLKIETGVIHNPHYYEYQRTQNGGQAPRVRGDDNGQNAIPDVPTCLFHWSRLPHDVSDRLINIHLMVSHLCQDEIPRFPTVYDNQDNEDIRQQYLKQEICEERFKSTLQRRDKKQTLRREMRQIYEMFGNSVGDILRRSLVASVDDVGALFRECETLTKYTNDCLAKAAQVYSIRIKPLASL